ncbi:hypothetical protein MUY27_06765 [Mucilaginibacter sp. RS28]|uniref:Uncharacterized protein n=1 Tax=Mucilaginibacter straminoryzae TaxID=2932774 RepID=A0A9X1X2Z6_9SPHI|nr:hypothetical protein [Mucilaginibacter straminoryzae]MCJ8209405.1 hypothetical protein [Mucilaginibacter straminoryzae]
MKTYFFLLIAIVLFAGCHKNETKPVVACEPMACTLNFASVTVKFLDKDGNATAVTDFTSVNARTKTKVPYSGANQGYVGYYTVANDSNLKDIAQDGDVVIVTAKNPASGQTLSTTFKIAGGCRCHIEKLSGPAEVQFTK